MITLFFLGFLILVLLWNLYYAKHWNKNLTVSLKFLQDFVYAGEQAEMAEQIENRKRLVLPVLEVAFHMDKNLFFSDFENTNVSDFTYKRDIFALLGNQRVTRKLLLQCTRRGYYRIERYDLTSFSMLHRQRYSAECPACAELYVYAKDCDVSDILVACERFMGSVQCAKRLFEDPFAFASIREYTIADPMKTINWKASARTGELMVNTFESTITEKVMIYLDIEDAGILKYEYLTEMSVSIAASIARKLIARGMEVGIAVNWSAGENASTMETEAAQEKSQPFTIIEPAGGKKQLTRIEQLLAKGKSEEVSLSFADLLSIRKSGEMEVYDTAVINDTTDINGTTVRNGRTAGPPEDAVTILISKNVSENQEAIMEFAVRDSQIVWVVPCPKNETLEADAPGNICLIKREVENS